jgi:hypothetical protein
MGLYINKAKIGKPYINGIKHNAYLGGEKIWKDVPPIPPIPPIPEGAFAITIQDNGSFNLPLRGVNGSTSTYQSYDWEIDWGDGNIEIVSGTGGANESIAHTYTDNLIIHTIIIKPNGTATQGWLDAFGTGSADAANSAKIKLINSQITTLMRTMNFYSFYAMFQNCTGLTSIPEGLLPATTLANGCYSGMFYGCTGLTAIPENLLSATTLASSCYNNMFNSCTGLTAIPEGLLPATTLVDGCYSGMFYGCTGLTSIGNIDSDWFSAKTPSQSGMFTGCILITTPIDYSEIPTGW